MEVTESVARAALDTLSSQIAVLDADGQILFTNSAWGAIGDEAAADGTADAEGTNYFASVDLSEDDFAADAVSGIRDVLDGESDEFTLEYPCHTPDEQRWFLMRATPFSLAERNFVTVAHIDITDRRLAELEATTHAKRAERERANLEHLLDRIHGLVQDITRLLVEAVSREEIEQLVCERLAETDPYAGAWIADTDIPSDRLTAHTVAGSVDSETIDRQFGATATDPSVRALEDGTVQIVQSVAEDRHLGEVYGDTAIESLIAVPLVTRESSYGVLTIYSDESDAFDERERAVLEALGRAIATAINAVQSKRTLTTNRIVEMEFTIEDDRLFPNRLSIATERSVSYSGSVYQSDGLLQVFYTVEDADPETVSEFVDGDPEVVDYRLLADHETELLCQFTLRDSLVDTLGERGAVTQDLTARDGCARVTVELPQEADARSLFERLSDRYELTDLVGYHEHERPVQTRQEFRSGLEDRLTDRQRTALRMAYYSGFFDWPRGVDGDELADMMDISRSTFHQHLRVAERKVLEAFFETR